MGTITATAQPEKGRVRLDIDWTSHPSPRCAVYRIVAGGTPVLIREGAPCVLSHNKATIYDTEGPLDQQTTYRSIVQLNDNADMELTVEDWQAPTFTVGGVATQSLDYYSAGNASLLFTPNGTTAAPVVLSDRFNVAVGTSYTATLQLLSRSRWSGGVGVVIRWYDGLDVLLSTSGTASNLWPATGQWETYTITATAPASTVNARIGVLFANTPPATCLFHVDEAYATTPLGTVDSGVVVMPSSLGGWWKDPLHPATMVRVMDQETSFKKIQQCGQFSGACLVNVSRPSRPADSAVLEVPNQALGVGVFAHRKAGRRTVTVATGGSADADALRTLHDQGGPLLLQLPAAYGIPEQYSLCASLDSTALGGDMTRQIEVHQVQVVHVQPPPGPNEGVLGARYQDLRKGGAATTYAAATAASLTWQDGLKGLIS